MSKFRHQIHSMDREDTLEEALTVMLAVVNRHFYTFDLCACLHSYGCPWRPEEGGGEWHNTGAGIQTLVVCTNLSAHKH